MEKSRSSHLVGSGPLLVPQRPIETFSLEGVLQTSVIHAYILDAINC